MNPGKAALARQLYDARLLKVAEIAATLGVSRETISGRAIIRAKSDA
jgi:hypothetical protein